MDKRTLSERDICTKYITPALVKSGWNLRTQIFEECSLFKYYASSSSYTKKCIENKRADYVLYYNDDCPIAIIEAKAYRHSAYAGIEQAKTYAEILNIPFAFSSNGGGFVLYDRLSGKETFLELNQFPSPEQLWEKWHHQNNNKNFVNDQQPIDKKFVTCPFCKRTFNYVPAMRGQKLKCICRRTFFLEEALRTQYHPRLRTQYHHREEDFGSGCLFMIIIIGIVCGATLLSGMCLPL